MLLYSMLYVIILLDIHVFITLHSKLYMSSLFQFIIVNVMFYLFYLQVEPVILATCRQNGLKCYLSGVRTNTQCENSSICV